jgi:UDPglucose--hexose-1-phosphate uridylyltransferase
MPGGPLTEIEFKDFEIAVFQNRFAGLHPQAEKPAGLPPGIEGAAAKGDCEVVVYTADGEGSLASLTQDRRRLLVSAWCDRYEALEKAGAAFTMPFESRGREVGVTLDHPHGQIYAFPFVPHTQARMVSAFEKGYRLARAVQEWGADYLVEEAGPLRAVVPPFARYPYEVWIVPSEPVRGPWQFGPEAFDAYAHLLGQVTRRYDAFFGRPAATLMSLQAAPAKAGDSFEFTTQFFSLLRAPDRIKYLASVEQATNVFTVDVMPEAAAKALREVF